MLISVVIPLYNKEPIIEKSLRSVLSQDCDDFEVVVVNDGSTDKSVEIVKKINDPRVTLIEQENGGPSKARNTGAKYSKGEWLIFLDADDELLPGALDNFNSLIKGNPAIEFFCCDFCADSEIYTSGMNVHRTIIVENGFKIHFHDLILPRMGSVMYSKKLFDSCRFNEKICRYEDFENIFRVYARVPAFLISPICVLKVNTKYSEASRGRADVKEDFFGHIDLKFKPFWEKLCLYKFYLSERMLYPESKSLYSTLYRRYDMLFIYKSIAWMKSNAIMWNLYLRIVGLSQFISKTFK